MRKLLDFRERSKLRHLLYAKPTIILCALLVALVFRAAWGMYQKSEEALAKRDKADADRTSLVARENELREDISRLSTAEGVEAELRSRFMIAKEGEKVMIIADPSAAEPRTVVVNDPPSFFEELLGAVGLGGR